MKIMKTGAQLIAEERQRQRDVEGWTDEGDDTYTGHELVKAALVYTNSLLPDHGYLASSFVWPFDPSWDKRDKHPPIRRLAIAGALIAAEIDRLLRADNKG